MTGLGHTLTTGTTADGKEVLATIIRILAAGVTETATAGWSSFAKITPRACAAVRVACRCAASCGINEHRVRQ